MPVNPETTPRKLVSVSDAMVQAIGDYRFRERINTKPEIICSLIEIGLKAALSHNAAGGTSNG